MKTILEIKKNFSNEEIKLLIEIVKGKQEFDVMGEQIKDFYADEYNESDLKYTRSIVTGKLLLTFNYFY